MVIVYLITLNDTYSVGILWTRDRPTRKICVYCKGEDQGHPRTGHEGSEWVYFYYSFFNFGSRSGRVVYATPRPLYLRERRRTLCV